MMPSHQPLPSIGADQAGSSQLARRFYAAIVIGLAIFLLGLLFWPSPRSARKSLTIIEVETRSLEFSSHSQVENRLRQIKEECVRTDRLRDVLLVLGEEDPSATRLPLESVAENLSFRLLPNEGTITAHNLWRIEVAYVGDGEPFESKLVWALGNEVIRRWQNSSHTDSTEVILDEVCDILTIDTARLFDLSARIPNLADEQWHKIESALNQEYATTSFDAEVQSTQETESVEGDVSHVDLKDFGPIGQPTFNAPQTSGRNKIENPNWVAISNERARLEEVYDRLRRQNQWPPSHPELERLDRDLQLIYRELAVTPRFVSSRDNEVVVNNRGGRIPAQFVENARIGTSSVGNPNQPTASPTLDAQTTLKIQDALRQPMMDLHFEVTDLARGWNRSLDDIESQRKERSIPAIDSISVAEPAHTESRMLPKGLGWRLSLIAFLAAIGSASVLIISSQKEESTLEAGESIELTLGIPVVGRLGNTSRSLPRFAKWKELPTWTRIAESTVLVLGSLVFVIAMGEPNGITDLAQNPLLTVCDILGSIARF